MLTPAHGPSTVGHWYLWRCPNARSFSMGRVRGLGGREWGVIFGEQARQWALAPIVLASLTHSTLLDRESKVTMGRARHDAQPSRARFAAIASTSNVDKSNVDPERQSDRRARTKSHVVPICGNLRHYSEHQTDAKQTPIVGPRHHLASTRL